MARIWTIGHSVHPIEKFIEMLQSFGIELVVDIRRYPRSRWCPQFNELVLQESLAEAGIDYLHMPGLGGRREVSGAPKSKHGSFGGYREHMRTGEFNTALAELERLALKKPTAHMCAEADWRKCHRSLVSDVLMEKGWEVLHIRNVGVGEPHDVIS